LKKSQRLKKRMLMTKGCIGIRAAAIDSSINGCCADMVAALKSSKL